MTAPSTPSWPHAEHDYTFSCLDCSEVTINAGHGDGKSYDSPPPHKHKGHHWEFDCATCGFRATAVGIAPITHAGKGQA